MELGRCSVCLSCRLKWKWKNWFSAGWTKFEKIKVEKCERIFDQTKEISFDEKFNRFLNSEKRIELNSTRIVEPRRSISWFGKQKRKFPLKSVWRIEIGPRIRFSMRNSLGTRKLSVARTIRIGGDDRKKKFDESSKKNGSSSERVEMKLFVFHLCFEPRKKKSNFHFALPFFCSNRISRKRKNIRTTEQVEKRTRRVQSEEKPTVRGSVSRFVAFRRAKAHRNSNRCPSRKRSSSQNENEKIYKFFCFRESNRFVTVKTSLGQLLREQPTGFCWFHTSRFIVHSSFYQINVFFAILFYLLNSVLENN